MSRISSGGTPLRNSVTASPERPSLRWLWFGAVVITAVVYDLMLLSNGTFRLFAPEFLDGVFNSMLLNLLHGDFTVARDTVGFEAFTRDGCTYTYFGVFPALLRLLAMPFMDIAQAHLARISCLTAIVIFVALQMYTLLVVHESLPPASRSPLLLVVLVAATVLSGPQLYLLGSSFIYHEPIFWGAALGAAFNLVVVRAALGAAGLDLSDLAALALLAGLAINTRATMGVALYLGTGLLAAGAALSFRLPAARRFVVAVPRMALDKRVWLPFLILAAFAFAVGAINYGRWGNPLTFADVRYYDLFQRFPQRLAIYSNYGLFNLERVGVSLLYYATGIPDQVRGLSPFKEFIATRFDLLDAPPSSEFLTNPLTIVLATIGLCRLVRRPDIRTEGTVILRLALIGHAASVILILSAISATLRYHFDFAPFMTLAAFVGYRSLSLAAAASPSYYRAIRATAVSLCALGIVGSHYLLVVHKIWSFGAPIEVSRTLQLLVPSINPAIPFGYPRPPLR